MYVCTISSGIWTRPSNISELSGICTFIVWSLDFTFTFLISLARVPSMDAFFSFEGSASPSISVTDVASEIFTRPYFSLSAREFLRSDSVFCIPSTVRSIPEILFKSSRFTPPPVRMVFEPVRTASCMIYSYKPPIYKEPWHSTNAFDVLDPANLF